MVHSDLEKYCVRDTNHITLSGTIWPKPEATVPGEETDKEEEEEGEDEEEERDDYKEEKVHYEEEEVDHEDWLRLVILDYKLEEDTEEKYDDSDEDDYYCEKKEDYEDEEVEEDEEEMVVRGGWVTCGCRTALLTSLSGAMLEVHARKTE